MPRDVIGVERLLRDHGLRGRHQGAIGRDLLGPKRLGSFEVRIRPVVGERGALLAAQQRDRVGEIGVKRRLVLDERPRRGVAEEGRAKLAEPVSAARAPLGEIERGGRVEEPARRLRREREPGGDLGDGQRAVAQGLESLSCVQAKSACE